MVMGSADSASETLAGSRHGSQAAAYIYRHDVTKSRFYPRFAPSLLEDPEMRSEDVSRERQKAGPTRSGNRSTPLPGLRAARRKRGMTQRELAALAKIGHGTVSELETGRRSAYPRTIRRIANGLEISIEDLVE